MLIDPDMLNDLAAGSVFLATGGGGDSYVMLLLAEQILRRKGPVELIDPHRVRDDAFVVAIGGLGAPSISLELLPSATGPAIALAAMEELAGRRIDVLAPVEVGGANSLIPIIAAAGHGIPVVDGDGMGRAFPETQMMTYSIGGIRPTPAVAADFAGSITRFTDETPTSYERKARELAMQSGGAVIAAEHPMSGKDLKRTVASNTLSLAIGLGIALREHNGPADSHLCNRLNDLFAPTTYGTVALLSTGTIDRVSTRVVGGFDMGDVQIRPLDGRAPPLSISIKNEFLVAWQDRKPVVMPPDLITVVDHETAVPINAERIRYGQRVTVFAIGSPTHYLTEEALSAVGPRCFGFDFDYESFSKE